MVEEVAAIQARADANGISIQRVINRTNPKIAYSTWCRWKNGTPPNLSRLNAVRQALDELIAEKHPA